MRIVGAATPMRAYPGRTPTMNVDMPMMRIVTRKVYFRPTRSPIRPKTMAPNGRTAKPAEKASSAKMKFSDGLTAEKNCFPMIAASEP